jgi:hypothetical protein
MLTPGCNNSNLSQLQSLTGVVSANAVNNNYAERRKLRAPLGVESLT